MFRFVTLLSGSLTLLFTCAAMMPQEPPVGQTVGTKCMQGVNCEGWIWNGNRPLGCSSSCVGNCTYCATGANVNVCRETDDPMDQCSSQHGPSAPVCGLMYAPPCKQIAAGCSCETDLTETEVILGDGVTQAQCRWNCS